MQNTGLKKYPDAQYLLEQNYHPQKHLRLRIDVIKNNRTARERTLDRNIDGKKGYIGDTEDEHNYCSQIQKEMREKTNLWYFRYYHHAQFPCSEEML